MKNSELFEKESAYKVIIKMGIPVIVTMLVVVLYNMADLFFVGKTGDYRQMAAVSLVSPIFVILMACGTLIGGGGCVAISLAMGKKQAEDIKALSSLCAMLSIVIGIIFAIIILFNRNTVLSMLGTQEETWTYTSNYLTIMSLGAPIVLFSNVFANVIRAEGAIKEAMIGNGIGTISNIILDAIFILIFHMGVSGAAVATVLGNLLGAIYLIHYFVKKSTSLTLKPKYGLKRMKLSWMIIALGFPSAVSNLLGSVSSVFSNNIVSQYGADAIAALGVAGKVTMLVAMIGMGVSFGVQPVLSYNYGAGNIKRTRELYFKTAITGTLVCVILTVTCFLGREAIVKMFLSDESFVAFSKKVAGIYLISAPIYGIFYLGTTFLQATGKVLLSTLISVMRQGIVFIPLLIIMNNLKGLDGVIYSGVVADVIAGIFGTGLSLMILYKFGRSVQSIKTGDIGTKNIEIENIGTENIETENIGTGTSSTDISKLAE